ncbi:MAG TPA: hypothetical protein VHL57_03870 [Flavobacteriales bacterium]|nr:hypothetical protein [Flavobacteriales bacterium]
MTSALSKAIWGADSAGLAAVQPRQMYFNADDYSVGTFPSGSVTADGLYKIGFANPGTTVTPRIRLSGLGDSEKVLTFDESSAATTALYALFCSLSSTSSFLQPVSDLSYVSFKWRELSYGAFTTTNTSNSAIMGAWNDPNNSSTADTPCHIKGNYSLMRVTQYSDAAEAPIWVTGNTSVSDGGVTIGGTDPANGWRNMEMVLCAARGLIVIKDWMGNVYPYSTRGAQDFGPKFPFFEWYIGGSMANAHRFELKEMRGNDTTSLTPGNYKWINNILTAAGEQNFGGPTPATSSVIDLFTRPDTPVSQANLKGAAGQDWISPWKDTTSGNSQFLSIKTNALSAGWGGWFDCSGVRGDYIFPGNNQEVHATAGSSLGVIMLPIWLGTDGCVMMYAAAGNSMAPQTSTGFTETRSTVGSGSNAANPLTSGADYMIRGVGRFALTYQAGVLMGSWLDSANARTRDANHRRMGAAIYQSTGGTATGALDVTHVPLADDYFCNAKMVKNGSSQAFTTSWAVLTPMVVVNSATASVPDWSSVLSGSNGLYAIGSRTNVRATASVPYTGNTSARSVQCRIKQNATVIATSSALTTATGTLTCQADVTVASEDVFTIEIITNNATGTGSASATTPSLTLIQQ